MCYALIEGEIVRLEMAQFLRVDRTGLKHPDTVKLHDVWSRLRAGRDAPYRAEVTAEAIGRPLAASTFVLESIGLGESGAADLRFRHVGSGIGDLFGMELRGMSALGLTEGGSRERLAALARACLADGEVGVAEGVAVGPNGEALAFEMILAPLRSDFGRMDRLLGAVVLLDGPAPESALPTARRLRLTEARRISGDGVKGAGAPLPGFAEGASAFAGKDAAPKPDAPKPAPPKPAVLKPIDGDGKTDAPRKDHLKLVKD